MKKIRPIAIYLPQFHPIPENDAAWGEGFTEWTNVKKAKPLYFGHCQPHKPHPSISYYDLSDPEVLAGQAELAKKYGIEGFAFYHYWFNGKRLLNLPIDNMLATGTPDFPFYLIWANETWSRRWLGQEEEIIIKQTYSAEDDLIHMRWLINVFADPRYIRINNRPVFIIYRPFDLPDISGFLKTFKNECREAGMQEPYFIASNSHAGRKDPRKSGFDAVMNFEPQLSVAPYYLDDKPSVVKFKNNLKRGILSARLKVYDYSTVKEQMQNRSLAYPYFPCSFVNWDNSPRRGVDGIIFKNGSPQLFRKYLLESLKKFAGMGFSEDENLVMINAWNEWAEGNYLEPDEKFGFDYLEVLKEVIDEVNGPAKTLA
jgi:hypothetical protein